MSECINCDGVGYYEPECETCGRDGWVDDPSDGGTMECEDCCGGSADECSECEGTGFIEEEEE